jgi:hypothetical protein
VGFRFLKPAKLNAVHAVSFAGVDAGILDKKPIFCDDVFALVELNVLKARLLSCV